MTQMEPWKTDKWFVSPWNFLPEVQGEFAFPAQVRIHDVTLRDGEQQAGIEFTTDEKVGIAEKLAEAGVHRIEAGLPAVSQADYEAVKAIARRNLPCEVFAFSRCRVDDVKMAVDCGVKGIVIEIPSSEHIIRYAYKWPVERAVELAIEATRYAKSQGLYVTFFPIDASRAEMTWYLSLIERIATEGHMDALALVDTFGVLSSHAVGYFVRRTRERIKKPLETHFHMDFGLGVANTIIALANGAEVVHTTVTGLGERAGNTAMEDTVLSLLMLYGVDTGVKLDKLHELSQWVRQLANHPLPPNREIVGDHLFDVESGIITTWYKNLRDLDRHHLTEMFPFLPEAVGQNEVSIVLGKGSGLDSVALWLDKVGLEASEAAMQEILLEVKGKSLDKKGLLTEDEFRRVAEGILGKPSS
ncbi:MAG: LeuA family protein [Dehalococcoidia bacterium]